MCESWLRVLSCPGCRRDVAELQERPSWVLSFQRMRGQGGTNPRRSARTKAERCANSLLATAGATRCAAVKGEVVGRPRLLAASGDAALTSLTKWVHTHLDAADASYGQIAHDVYLSRSSVSRALCGRRLPAWELVEAVAVRCRASQSEARRLWDAADAAQRRREAHCSRNSHGADRLVGEHVPGLGRSHRCQGRVTSRTGPTRRQRAPHPFGPRGDPAVRAVAVLRGACPDPGSLRSQRRRANRVDDGVGTLGQAAPQGDGRPPQGYRPESASAVALHAPSVVLTVSGGMTPSARSRNANRTRSALASGRKGGLRGAVTTIVAAWATARAASSGARAGGQIQPPALPLRRRVAGTPGHQRAVRRRPRVPALRVRPMA